MPNGENPLLLSLAAQKTLGLCKDVDTGTCYCKHSGSFVQLYSVLGSTLRAIVIHDPDWKKRFSISRTFGAPAVEEKPKPLEEAKELVKEMQTEAFETAYDLAATQGQVTFCKECKARYLVSDSYCWSCGTPNWFSAVPKRGPPDSEIEPPKKKSHNCYLPETPSDSPESDGQAIPDSSDDATTHNTEIQKKRSVPPWKKTTHNWQIHRKRATEAIAEEANDHVHVQS